MSSIDLSQAELALADISWVLRNMAAKSGVEIPPVPEEYYPNRFGLRDQEPLALGVRNSGQKQVLKALVSGTSASFECANTKGVESELATVYVSCVDASARSIEVGPNQRVRLAVRWETGRGGGDALIDCTTGTCFTIAGANLVGIKATLESGDEGVALRPGQDQELEMAVAWGGAKSPRPCFWTSTRQAVLANMGTAVGIPVPPYAQRMDALASVSTTITASFFRGPTTLGAPAYVKPMNQTIAYVVPPIVHGVKFVSLSPTDDASVMACFELYL